jgi:glycyl-tRNA synthetase (class II)
MNDTKYKTFPYPFNDNVYIVNILLLNNMLVRLDQAFLETTQKLKNPFTPADKEKLAEDIELNYNKIMSIISAQELAKENSKPAIIELGNIGSRFFALNIYYNTDENREDVPRIIQELLPSISPVKVDVLATTTAHQVPDDPNVTYLKVAQIYDDGSRDSKYLDEVRKEDEGISPF